MAALHRNLADSSTLDCNTKNAIIDSFWPCATLEDPEQYDWNPYFEYYVSQCHHALHDRGKHITPRTHQDIVDICEGLRKAQPHATIKIQHGISNTAASTSQDDISNNSIDLAARLYAMVNVGSTKATITPGRTHLCWAHGDMKTFLGGLFPKTKALTVGNIKFEKTFTARTIDCIAGIQIKWTDNFADHLRIMDADDKTVAIFHHVSFLKRQHDHLFPDGLIEETLRTLAFLFPRYDKQTRKWLQSQSNLKERYIDQQLLMCTPLRLVDRRIENFGFWHDRLIMLKQSYDESRPATLSQWWHDRRNGAQWYTFWVAIVVLILTVFFGLVQSLEGALQVYKAYHPANP